VTLRNLTSEGIKEITPDGIVRREEGRAVRGARRYTRTCSQRHLPSYVGNIAALKAKGVDTIACLAVNDAFVMGAWGKEHGAEGKVMMLGDGSGEFTRAMGLELDRVKEGMGVRSQRYAMLVENGVVKALNVEQPGEYAVSSAEAMLEKL